MKNKVLLITTLLLLTRSSRVFSFVTLSKQPIPLYYISSYSTESRLILKSKSTSNNNSRRKKILSSIVSILALSSSVAPRSNAVIGYIPKGASGLRDQDQSRAKEEQQTPKEIPPEILEKYGDNDRLKELELKVYSSPSSPKKEIEENTDLDSNKGGMRPGVSNENEELLKLVPDIPTTTSKSSSFSTQKKTTKSPKNKIRSIAQFSFLGAVGFTWAKTQSTTEQKRLKRGIEIYESQKAEFFNVTGTGDTDENLQKAIQNLNATTSLEDEEEEEDDDDDDIVSKNEPNAKPKPKKPSSGDGMPGSSLGSGSSPGPSKDDVQKLKKLFDKK